MLNSYESRAIRLMAEMLDNSIAEKVGVVSQGTAPDYPAYKYLCGYIKALTDVVEFLEQIDQDMREGK